MARKMLIQVRRDTAANWTSANPTLAAGEWGFETNTGKTKIGDGSTAWSSLSYFVPGVGAGGGVATDVIWDAAGDLAVGTGADAASKLALGASGKAPISNGSTLAYAYPPGYEFDYVEKTTNTSITATTLATANTIVTGASVTYDGSTIVVIQWQAYAIGPPADGFLTVCLYDGSTLLCAIDDLAGTVSGSTTWTGDKGSSGQLRLTPSAAAHQYSVRAAVNAGTGTVFAGAGTGGANAPCFMRIVKAT